MRFFMVSIAVQILLLAGRTCIAAADVPPGSGAVQATAKSLSVAAGYASYSIPEPENAPSGTALSVEYQHGFSDSMAVRVAGGAGAYFSGGDPEADTSYSGQFSLGLTYAFDLLPGYLPYIGGGIGGIVITGGAPEQQTTFEPLVAMVVGLDILASARFSIGFRTELETRVVRTSFFTAGLRATYRWKSF